MMFLMYGLWPGCVAFVSTVFGWPALVAQYVFWPGADGVRPLEDMTSITNQKTSKYCDCFSISPGAEVQIRQGQWKRCQLYSKSNEMLRYLRVPGAEQQQQQQQHQHQHQNKYHGQSSSRDRRRHARAPCSIVGAGAGCRGHVRPRRQRTRGRPRRPR